jgi:hypothetical protein
MLVLGGVVFLVAVVLWSLGSGLWLCTRSGRQRWQALAGGESPASWFEATQVPGWVAVRLAQTAPADSRAWTVLAVLQATVAVSLALGMLVVLGLLVVQF